MRSLIIGSILASALAAPVQADCIDPLDVRAWTAYGNSALLVKTGDHHFLVGLEGQCLQQSRREVVSFESRGAYACVGDGVFVQAGFCVIRELAELTDTEYARLDEHATRLLSESMTRTAGSGSGRDGVQRALQ